MTNKLSNLQDNIKLERSEHLASILAILRAFDEKRELREQFPFVLSSIKGSYKCTKNVAQVIKQVSLP